ncbi:hypothetical protein A3A66_03055 [Microgenomates group bacterium RIFCSPLOWO2_01_FULL_46_13]|nr:MAG: hypothetical protein A3A66_03055 [Microgenomates group bacterium RIFCSPLOWO2_01_FULL_46_13]
MLGPDLEQFLETQLQRPEVQTYFRVIAPLRRLNDQLKAITAATVEEYLDKSGKLFEEATITIAEQYGVSRGKVVAEFWSLKGRGWFDPVTIDWDTCAYAPPDDW